jgi:hypothetical protein
VTKVLKRALTASSDTWKAFGESAAFATTCLEYHTAVKARDFVFTSFAKR